MSTSVVPFSLKDVVVRWNGFTDLTTASVSLKLEDASWVHEKSGSWYSWRSEYAEDSNDTREVFPFESNLSQKHIFSCKKNKPAKIFVLTSVERDAKVFDVPKPYPHLIIELYTQGAELGHYQEGPTTLETVAKGISNAVGVTYNLSQNTYNTLVEVPGALSRVATRIGRTASKIIYG